MMIRLPLLGALALLLGAVGPAAAQTDGGLFGNIFKPPAAATQDAGRAGTDSEIVARMERLESSLRQLTGQVEQLQFRNQQLEDKIRRLEEGGGAGTAVGPRPPAATGPLAPPAGGPGGRPAPTPATPGKRSDAFDPNADPSAPGAPQPLGSPASAAPPRSADAGRGAAAGSQLAALPAPGGAAREIYDIGQAQIQRQDYAAAEQTFRQLLETYPSDRVVPDATFMLGESLFLRQNYADAATSFLDVTTKFPNSTRGPEALLRLGQSLAMIGQKETACAALQQLERKYPRAASSIRQAVEQEQKRVGC